MRGDLLEGHIYDKRLCGYASLMPIPRLLEHKIGVLCQKGQLFPGFAPSRAQNRGIGVFVLGKSNRGESVGRKGRVIEERTKGRRNLRDAYGAQYSKKIIFLLFIPFI